MPLDNLFFQTVAPLLRRGMGTENIGPLLYYLVRMTRPRNVLEVGLGYTTPFIAQALRDAIDEFRADRQLLGDGHDPGRASVLSTGYLKSDYAPRLHAIDDYSVEGSSAQKARETLDALGLGGLTELHQGDFRGLSKSMPGDTFPLDLVWYDCGGLPEYIDFIEEYWELINPDHGLLLLHFTYWPFLVDGAGVLTPKRDSGPTANEVRLVSNPILNEIKKQQAAAGSQARFEVLSMVEPHKEYQGSVTMIRRLAATSMCRPADFQREVMEIFGEKPKPLISL